MIETRVVDPRLANATDPVLHAMAARIDLLITCELDEFREREDAELAAEQLLDRAFGRDPERPDYELELELAEANLAHRRDELTACNLVLSDLLERQSEIDDVLEQRADARRRDEFAEACRRALCAMPGDDSELRYADAACD